MEKNPSSFGYKIGRKIRLMSVHFHTDLLWPVCVREIYVLMKHYGSMEALKKAFENLKEAKGTPKVKDIESCKMFTDIKTSNENKPDWYSLTRYCQHSFINMLESGYILNNGKEEGLIFMLDFNTNTVSLYTKDSQKKVTEHQKATMEEIMEFDDMPTKSLTEIMTNTKERYNNYYEKLEKVNAEGTKIEDILCKSKQLNDHNIMTKAQKLWDDMDCERKKLELGYRVFYHRLDALNLIDYSDV
jgi:hypothetical protein